MTTRRRDAAAVAMTSTFTFERTGRIPPPLLGHIWQRDGDDLRCERCGMLSHWPGARIECGSVVEAGRRGGRP